MKKSICVIKLMSNNNLRKALSEALKEQGFQCIGYEAKFKRNNKLLLDM